MEATKYERPRRLQSVNYLLMGEFFMVALTTIRYNSAEAVGDNPI